MFYALAEGEAGVFCCLIGEQPALGRAERAADLAAQSDLLNQLSRNFADKARDLVEGFAAVQTAGFCPGDHQLLHRPGDADVSQAALFLQAARVFQAHLVREQAFFDARHEHQRKLQALGAVQGHQLHAVFKAVCLGFTGFQRGVREKRQQHVALVFGIGHIVLEATGGGHQFFQVLYPGLALVALLLLVKTQQAAVLNGDLGLAVERQALGALRHLLDQHHKALHRIGGAARQALVVEQVAGRLPHRDILLTCLLAQQLDGLVTNATGGQVDDALQRAVITTTAHQAQIRHGILDFCPFKKALTAVDAVGNAAAQQRLFQHPRLGVGAIKNGNLAAAQAVSNALLNALDNKARLILLIEAGIQGNRVAFVAVGPQLLAQAPGVVADQRVGRLEDGRSRAVVLLQTDHLGVRVVGLELLNVFDSRPAPAVDRLVVVAHHHQAG